MKIGKFEIENGLVLPAVAGYGDVGFRALCRRYGAGLTVTEMVSAKGLHYKNENTRILLVKEDETPSCAQIFGHEPEILAESATTDLMQSFDMIDINFGCPVPKIVGNGDGSALLKNPKLMTEIVKAVKNAVPDKAVTAKMRLGFADGSAATECASAIEEGGADALTVHGRTRNQLYSGVCDLEGVARVKESVKIPVIGNGDVTDRESYLKMKTTGVDGVAIARGALGKPYIFSAVLGKEYEFDVKEAFLEHISLLKRHYPDRLIVANMKKHVAAYAKGRKGGKYWKEAAFSAKNLDELITSISLFF